MTTNGHTFQLNLFLQCSCQREREMGHCVTNFYFHFNFMQILCLYMFTSAYKYIYSNKDLKYSSDSFLFNTTNSDYRIVSENINKIS